MAKELLKGVPPASFPAETLQLESFETPEAMFLNSLDSCNYEAHKNEIREADHYTCGWFTNNRTANRWWYSDAPYEFLWLTLERSRGKSVLVRNLVDVVLSNPCSLCYFFFKKEIGQSRGSLAAAMRAILHQLFTQKPAILRKLLQQYELQRQISEYEATFSGLWEIFLLAIEQDNVGRVVCLFDAFDDCQDEDRKGFLERVRALLGKRPGENTWVKILLTSRPTERVRFALHFLESELDDDHREHFRHLPGDDQNPSSLIQTEVKIVVENRITKIVESHGLSSEEEACLRENLGQLPKSTYLWVNRILTAIETDTQFSDKQVKSLVKRCFDDALGNKPFPATANIFSSSPPRYQTLR